MQGSLKCNNCGSADVDITSTMPRISIRPKDMKFWSLNIGGKKTAAQVCKSCGSVMFTVDPKKYSESKKGQMLSTIIIVIMMSLLTYMEYNLNELERGMEEDYKKITLKEEEVKSRDKQIKKLSSTQNSLLDLLVIIADDKNDSEENSSVWKKIKKDISTIPIDARKEGILLALEKKSRQ